ncbi:hypothetical protein ONS95_003311 [Cadophora gregata]|uniref:uncharacterized protein n=1 Tax=Cadophora gregata TaxID=51156 RepID=UPI0026DD969C|nr:uncharacterized protein ONS95_003311 [Cadophora gregata]KAK0108507.1 hypothetical protein ONS95_003311 [Cadophora gregata]KAK0108899.1 hypothetical protein ONS96_002735 [Cadophora gregata f. sp. sojae]
MVIYDDRSSTRGSFQRSENLESTIQNVIRSLFRNDLFSGDEDVRFGGLRNLAGLSDDRRMEELMVNDMIRRVNLGVQLANSLVSPHMVHAEIHPKISDNGIYRGDYPREFEHPRRVEWFLSLESASLDRICQAYGLPTGGYSSSYDNPLFNNFREVFSRSWGPSYSSDTAREYRLLNLFQYLGVYVGDGPRHDRVSDTLDGNRLLGRGLGGPGSQRGLGWIS